MGSGERKHATPLLKSVRQKWGQAPRRLGASPHFCRTLLLIDGEQFYFSGAGDGVVKASRGGASCPHLAFRIESDEGHAGGLDAAALGDGIHSGNGHGACFLGSVAGAHRFHNQNTTAAANDFLTHTGGAGGAGTVIDIKPNADQWRITDTTGKLVCQPGRAYRHRPASLVDPE